MEVLHLRGDIDVFIWHQTLIATTLHPGCKGPNYKIPKNTREELRDRFEQAWKLAHPLGWWELETLNEILTQKITSDIEFFRQAMNSVTECTSEDGRALISPRTCEFFERERNRALACPYRWVACRNGQGKCHSTAPMTLLELIGRCTTVHSAHKRDSVQNSWSNIDNQLVLRPNLAGNIYCFLGDTSVFSPEDRNQLRAYPSLLGSPAISMINSVIAVVKGSKTVGYLIDGSSGHIKAGECSCVRQHGEYFGFGTTEGVPELLVALERTDLRNLETERKVIIEDFSPKLKVFKFSPRPCGGYMGRRVSMRGKWVRVNFASEHQSKITTRLKPIPTLVPRTE